jgi:spore coat polysaccharide biosynthesis protein SpsF
MKVSIIIEARLGSKRLPNKIIYRIKKYLFLEYLIKRLKQSKTINEIIIATTNLPQDNKIVQIAKKNKIKFYRGSENNVLKRVIDTAKHFKCKTIARVTSDCPIIDFTIVDQAVQMFKFNKCDYLSNAWIRGYPDGMDIEIFDLKTLIKSYKLAKTKRSREWVTWSIRKNPKIFSHINLIPPQELYWPELCLTLDEYDDYLLLKKIILYYKENINFTCQDVIKLLKKKKVWQKINKHVVRKLNINYKKVY